MSIQPGQGVYDDLAEELIRRTRARAVLLIVFEGERGDGLSLLAPPEFARALPEILHGTANDLATAVADEEESSPLILPEH